MRLSKDDMTYWERAKRRSKIWKVIYLGAYVLLLALAAWVMVQAVEWIGEALRLNGIKLPGGE